MNAGIDKPEWRTYGAAMERGQPFIRLKLDIEEPIEVGEFIAAFRAIADQYERYIQREGLKGKADASLFVREVRVGCIEADLVPFLIGTGVIGSALLLMQAANTVHDFVEKYGGTLKRLAGRKGERLSAPTKSELKAFSEQVQAIARVPGSTLRLAAMTVKDGKYEASTVFALSSDEARTLEFNTDAQRREMEAVSDADHKRVIMRFTRTDTSKSKIGKKAVEHAVIESVSARALPVIYASDLTEGRLRHEIVAESENVYWKGFVVDVNVETINGKPAAYRVTEVHSVIDLPKD